MTQQQPDKPHGQPNDAEATPMDIDRTGDSPDETPPGPRPAGGGDTEGQPDYGGN